MKDKSNQQEKDTKEGPNLQVAGPGGEITAGMIMCHRVHSNLAVHFFYVTVPEHFRFSKILLPCPFWFVRMNEPEFSIFG
jgi:hypothetical protein